MEATCRNCKADLRFSEDNCEPIPEPKPAMPTVEDTSFSAVSQGLTLSSAPIDPAENQCVRCGKEFRGDWDRHSTVMGDLCNICANRNVDDTPGTIGNPTESSRAVGENPYSDDDPFSAVPRPVDKAASRGPWFMEKYPEESRIILAVLAAGVIILAIWASFQENPSSLDPSSPEEAAEMMAAREAEAEALAERLKGVPGYMVFGIRYLLTIIGLGLPMYITLHITKRTPYDWFLANFLEVTAISLCLGIVGGFGFSGAVLALILTILILWTHYDVPALYVFMYFIIAALVNIMVWSAGILILGSIANTLR